MSKTIINTRVLKYQINLWIYNEIVGTEFILFNIYVLSSLRDVPSFNTCLISLITNSTGFSSNQNNLKNISRHHYFIDSIIQVTLIR